MMRRPLVLVFVAFIVIIFLSSLIFPIMQSKPVDGMSIESEMTILQIQKQDGKYTRMVVKGDKKYILKIIGEYDPRMKVGEKIKVRGDLEMPRGRSNPMSFNYRLYLKTLKIDYIINTRADNIAFTETTILNNTYGKFIGKIQDLKDTFAKKLSRFMSKESCELLEGIMFGEKSNISETEYENFQKNGVAHVLTVSGLHIGIIYAFLIFLLGKKNFKLKATAIVAFLIIYATLANFNIPVMRAVIIIMIHLVSILLKRTFDFLSAVSLSGIILLIFNPMLIFSASFILSYLAVMVIGFGLPWVRVFAKGSKVKEAVLFILLIQVGMAPVTIYLFNYFSLSAFLMNLPIIFIVEIILPIGMILFVLANISFSLPIFTLLCFVQDFLISFMRGALAFVSQIKFLSYTVPSMPFYILILLYLIFFFVLSDSFKIFGSRKMYKQIGVVVGIFVVCSIGVSFNNYYKQNRADITFIDVGQGDGIHVRLSNGKNLLIDGGGNENYFGGESYNVGKNVLAPYFLKNGVGKIDYYVATHLHTDHFKGAKELSNIMPIKNAFFYNGYELSKSSIYDNSNFEKTNINFVYYPMEVKLDKDLTIKILYPSKFDSDVLPKDENEISLVFVVNFKGVKTIFTGDMGFDGERNMMSLAKTLDLNVDILKVGHHGSKYSTSDEFLATIKPNIAVIQVGKNSYGHPTPEVLERLESIKAKVFRNDTQGALMLYIDRGKYYFKDMSKYI